MKAIEDILDGATPVEVTPPSAEELRRALRRRARHRRSLVGVFATVVVGVVGLGVVAGLGDDQRIESSGDRSVTSETGPAPSTPPEPRPEPATETNVEAEQVSANPLPGSYEIVATTSVQGSEAGNKTALRRVTAVGRTQADPRLIEYTLYEFNDEESARAAASAQTEAVLIEPIALDRGGIVGFVQPADQPVERLRAQQELVPHGPSFDAYFQVLVGPTVLAVGASAVVHPTILAPLLESLSTDLETFERVLPDGMAILVDEAPLDGMSFELRSTHGTTTVELYPGASRSWFDYFTWGTPAEATDGALVGLADDVRVRPAARYAFGGAAIDPEHTMVWTEDRLVIVTHPDATPSTKLAELLAFFLGLDGDEALSLADPVESGPGEDAPQDDPPPERPTVSDAPTVDDMAQLQDFVETARGIEAGQPISFEFVDDFPVGEATGAQFLSHDLWRVAVALGLTEQGQTLEGANQARIDRIKGTPGLVELQATRVFTDVVVVHEMVHVIDPAPLVGAERELLSLGQAVSEGNAHRIAFDYLATLPQNEQSAVDDFPAIFAPEGDPRISTAVQDLLEFPYDEGRIFMAEIADRGGEAMIESVLRRPPTSTEQLLFVDAWIADDAPAAVGRPATPVGAESLTEGTLGAYLLFLTGREAGLGPEALGVLDRWAGDRYVSYEDDGQTCVAARILMDTSEAATELASLLDRAGSREVSAMASTVDAVFCA